MGTLLDRPGARGAHGAEAWLEEQARSEGWSRAERLRGRRATQGLVGLLQDRGLAVMVEVNCETDFVARNEEFQRLLQQAVLGTMAHCQGRAEPLAAPAKHFLQSEELLQLRAEPHGARLGDQVALAIGKLGENLRLRRAAWLAVPAGCHIGTYVHGAPPRVPPAPAVAMGKYGALVACAPAEPGAEAALRDVGRKVAQHVVGMAPRSLGSAEDEPVGEAETRLLAQSFLLEPAVTLGAFARAQRVNVLDFVRFECGEEAEAAP
ncbi:elongation factor Ts, mitochondrial [Nothoprocta perdicaria]|uniref:elongation factor Ts, mitochondrial n=1 Tax=Nothoprocta perdicaria TaxID=30464 RepID=UPI000E1C01BD|nr:elongation factor Ts, mitochondrial [Nothoprocta perdicaria]